MSDTAKSFVTECLTIDPASRPTAAEALRHKWLASEQPHFVQSPTGGPTNLLPQIQKAFDAKKTFRKAVFSMIATKRMSVLAGLSPTAQNFGHDIAQLKEESEKEVIDGVRIYHLSSLCISRRCCVVRFCGWGPGKLMFSSSVSSRRQDRSVTHYDGHNSEQEREDLKKQDDVSQSEAEGHTALVNKMDNLSV